jgi:hypothetical protein
MLLAQIALLKCFGILPLFEEKVNRTFYAKKILSAASTVLAVCLLLGTLSSICFQSAISLYGIIHQDSNRFSSMKSSDKILFIMRLMGVCAVDGRAFLLPFLLFMKRHTWIKLMRETNTFTQKFFCPIFSKGLGKKMRFYSFGLCLVTFGTHISWETAAFVIKSSVNTTITSDVMYGRLPIEYYLYQNIIVDTLFRIVPFILSQQVFLCVVILAVLLNETVQELNNRIHKQTITFETKNNSSELIGINEIVCLGKKIQKWKMYHLHLLLLCQSVDKFFNFILFAVYGLDFVALLGFTSNIVQGSTLDVYFFIFLICSSLIFLLYETALVFPLVTVHEKASSK